MAAAYRYEQGCKNGDMQSCADLAVYYWSGWGVKKDPLRANALFKEACYGGNAFGCRSVVADSLLPPTLTLVWLTGEQGEGGARAGVRVETKGHVAVSNGTVVVAPNGREFDLSTPIGFANMALSCSGQMATVVSLTRRSGAVKILADQLSILKPVSTKLEVRKHLVSEGSKGGTLTVKGKITGWVAINNDERGKLKVVLLPLEGLYEATGTIVKSISGTREQQEVTRITGAVLGFAYGEITLGLEGISGAGQHKFYVLPSWENEAFRGAAYRGEVNEVRDFGFARIPKSGVTDVLAKP
jgi:hypothetical protein